MCFFEGNVKAMPKLCRGSLGNVSKSSWRPFEKYLKGIGDPLGNAQIEVETCWSHLPTCLQPVGSKDTPRPIAHRVSAYIEHVLLIFTYLTFHMLKATWEMHHCCYDEISALHSWFSIKSRATGIVTTHKATGENAGEISGSETIYLGRSCGKFPAWRAFLHAYRSDTSPLSVRIRWNYWASP